MPRSSQATGTAQRWLHRVAHWTRHNYGSVETWEHEGTLMVGFRCNCGELTDVCKMPKVWP